MCPLGWWPPKSWPPSPPHRWWVVVVCGGGGLRSRTHRRMRACMRGHARARGRPTPSRAQSHARILLCGSPMRGGLPASPPCTTPNANPEVMTARAPACAHARRPGGPHAARVPGQRRRSISSGRSAAAASPQAISRGAGQHDGLHAGWAQRHGPQAAGARCSGWLHDEQGEHSWAHAWGDGCTCR